MLISAGCGNGPVDHSSDSPGEIDWGRQVTLDEMMAMCREGKIVEIQWHVMPNILRARAQDGSLYHFPNANKGVDLRSRLIEAGVPIGEGGLQFHHVF
jgi:hypothetical protein